MIKKLFSLSDVIKPVKDHLPHGKIHTPIVKGNDGKIYFGTHFGYPFGRPQSVKFEGGHWLSYDPLSRIVCDLGRPMSHGGIISLTMDRERMMLYGLSAPSCNFLAYDIGNRKHHVIGRINDRGSICRSLVAYRDGNVYGSFEDNSIFKFNVARSVVERLGTLLPDDSPGIKEWEGGYRRGVNFTGRKIWRAAVWNDEHRKIFGIHAGSSRLFSFDPETEEVRSHEFLAPDSYERRLDTIYPTLSLAQYTNTLYYVPAGGLFDYCRSEHLDEWSHLVSYNIDTGEKIDHGQITDERHRRVYGVAGSTVSTDGKLYLLGAVEVLRSEDYNDTDLCKINGKPFHLALMEIVLGRALNRFSRVSP